MALLGQRVVLDELSVYGLLCVQVKNVLDRCPKFFNVFSERSNIGVQLRRGKLELSHVVRDLLDRRLSQFLVAARVPQELLHHRYLVLADFLQLSSYGRNVYANILNRGEIIPIQTAHEFNCVGRDRYSRVDLEQSLASCSVLPALLYLGNAE